jgi:hypothetical protein
MSAVSQKLLLLQALVTYAVIDFHPRPPSLVESSFFRGSSYEIAPGVHFQYSLLIGCIYRTGRIVVCGGA